MPANSNIIRSRRALILGCYVALVAAFALAGVVPYIHGIASAHAAIASAQQEIDVHLKKKQQLVDVEKNIELVKRQVANYSRLVPENQEVGDFIGVLALELDKAGMKEFDKKTLASIALGKTQKLPIELHGNGTFMQFHNFLERLEHLQRMCSIGRLSVESTDSDMNGRVTVELVLYIYNTKAG